MNGGVENNDQYVQNEREKECLEYIEIVKRIGYAGRKGRNEK